MSYSSVFIDGLMGPSYHFGGLSLGNTWSETHFKEISFPKKAALEGLHKMFEVYSLGLHQYVLPPVRKDVSALFRSLGYDHFNSESLRELFSVNPYFVSSVFSSSSAWLANIGHVTPACDSFTHKMNVTPANLNYCFHRSCDVEGYRDLLSTLFENCHDVVLHRPITSSFGDEGSANTVRLSASSGEGFFLYVYGKTVDRTYSHKYPARQSKEAFDILVKQHHVSRKFVMVQQSQEAIDAGVFHNDVICFGLENLLIVHESAFENQEEVMSYVKELYEETFSEDLQVIVISREMMSLEEAVKSYFFNSQLLPLSDGGFHCFVSTHSRKYSALEQVLQYIQSECSRFSYSYVECDESIKNGGGPACLRLGFVASEHDRKLLNDAFLLTQERYDFLYSFISRHYPDEMQFEQLRDYEFLCECREIVDSLFREFTL
ncbi:hypothetical protein DID78_03615 [Candidatus Marinamargulisbacteria bacterium SCGC AG-343-D04]|nr:hypothetical protein DID78_03615 [Candidatus Marinamargulisbacteria bacterium SCGC AG-343-D04]